MKIASLLPSFKKKIANEKRSIKIETACYVERAPPHLGLALLGRSSLTFCIGGVIFDITIGV